jgi:hypothetical protein
VEDIANLGLCNNIHNDLRVNLHSVNLRDQEYTPQELRLERQ